MFTHPILLSIRTDVWGAALPTGNKRPQFPLDSVSPIHLGGPQPPTHPFHGTDKTWVFLSLLYNRNKSLGCCNYNETCVTSSFNHCNWATWSAGPQKFWTPGTHPIAASCQCPCPVRGLPGPHSTISQFYSSWSQKQWELKNLVVVGSMNLVYESNFDSYWAWVRLPERIQAPPLLCIIIIFL